jgi:hypothetical protein
MIASAPSSTLRGRLLRPDKFNACALDFGRATSDRFGEFDGVTISAVVDHNDLNPGLT